MGYEDWGDTMKYIIYTSLEDILEWVGNGGVYLRGIAMASVYFDPKLQQVNVKLGVKPYAIVLHTGHDRHLRVFPTREDFQHTPLLPPDKSYRTRDEIIWINREEWVKDPSVLVDVTP